MALFQKNEEKQLMKQEKKEAERLQALQFRNLDNLKDEKTKESVLKIIDKLKGQGLVEFGSFLTGNKTSDTNYLMKEYISAMFEQNWIIIKQLDELINK